MLSDRSYMRDSYARPPRPALTWIISAVIAGFILENVFERWFVSRMFSDFFALTPAGIAKGHLWQLITYSFVNPTESPLYVLYIIFNVLCLYMLGRELEGLLGTKRFVGLYLSAIVVGAGCWLAVNYRFGGEAFGAWPGVAALFTLYACLNADQEMPFLFFFFIPVTLKPKYLAWFALAVDFCGLAVWEVFGKASPLGWCHSAHLGGMLTGYLYYKLVHQREWRNPDSRADIELPGWLRKTQKTAVAAAPYKVNITTREDLRAEVDRILDKINSEGFNSLTAEEKRVLDEAKDSLSRP
jgi:membrane associated rhomboid family serine protease